MSVRVPVLQSGLGSFEAFIFQAKHPITREEGLVKVDLSHLYV